MYHKRKKDTPLKTVVYMEIYGSNRVIYQVVLRQLCHRNQERTVCGVVLRNTRTGETAALEEFSSSLGKTVAFLKTLVQMEAQPQELYNAAFRQLSTEVASLQKQLSR